MKSIIFCLAIFAASPLKAQQDAAAVLKAYTKAIGGTAAINSIDRIYAFAKCEGPNGSYETAMYSADGNKTIFRQKPKWKAGITGIINGQYAWTSGQELEPAGKEAAFAWRSHEVQWMALHLTDRFRELTYTGTDTFSGKQAARLSAIDELNHPAALYFDTQTKLLLGITLQSPFSAEPETIQLDIISWKKTGGVSVPATITFTDKGGKFTLNFNTVKLNEVDRRLFIVPPKIKAYTELLQLHELQRKAHFDRNAELLVSILADDFTELSNGKIKHPTREALLSRFRSYFNSVNFIEWDDINEPIIQLSDDATLATMQVHKRVRLRTNEGKEEQTVYAWTAVFEKKDGKWKMGSMTSTEGEGEVDN